ncbi:helix-turn-helix transcriptional regulator [Sphingomonas sp.]|uniref:response regulator transcription factor n=1 Tax=Sphingomonas sp. TaxID=28214 RepID=UPI001AFF9358|nr:helix-turn-helix transcriptional regulator [Sphingomonas sp.]MBO9711910.1 helix-turn-helix transcriptional regulator [Sphingomonas sp.]
MAEADPAVERARRAVSPLSDTQRACLRLVARGYQTKEVARELGISPLRAGKHIQAAMEKLGVSSRRLAAQLLVQAEQGGVNDSPGQESTLPGPAEPVPFVIPAERQERQPSGFREARAEFVFDYAPSPDPRLPLREPGSIRNDLSLWHRVFHILFLATVFMAAFGILAMGLGSFHGQARTEQSQSR